MDDFTGFYNFDEYSKYALQIILATTDKHYIFFMNYQRKQFIWTQDNAVLLFDSKVICFYTSYFPYDGKTGSQSSKSNGKDKEFYLFFFFF